MVKLFNSESMTGSYRAPEKWFDYVAGAVWHVFPPLTLDLVANALCMPYCACDESNLVTTSFFMGKERKKETLKKHLRGFEGRAHVCFAEHIRGPDLTSQISHFWEVCSAPCRPVNVTAEYLMHVVLLRLTIYILILNQLWLWHVVSSVCVTARQGGNLTLIEAPPVLLPFPPVDEKHFEPCMLDSCRLPLYPFDSLPPGDYDGDNSTFTIHTHKFCCKYLPDTWLEGRVRDSSLKPSVFTNTFTSFTSGIQTYWSCMPVSAALWGEET